MEVRGRMEACFSLRFDRADRRQNRRHDVIGVGDKSHAYGEPGLGIAIAHREIHDRYTKRLHGRAKTANTIHSGG